MVEKYIEVKKCKRCFRFEENVYESNKELKFPIVMKRNEENYCIYDRVSIKMMEEMITNQEDTFGEAATRCLRLLNY